MLTHELNTLPRSAFSLNRERMLTSETKQEKNEQILAQMFDLIIDHAKLFMKKLDTGNINGKFE